MQQRCTNCGAFLQPGSSVCTNCGAPVSSGAAGSYGSGAYDPTVRAGAPPNPGYGTPTYGAPQPPANFGAPQPPYGTPQPPYGTPQPPYGAPQPPYGTPQPPYGSSPYGAPPNPGFGAPMSPLADYPVMQPARKSRRGLFIGLGVSVIVVIVVIAALANGLGGFKQQVTTGTHVTKIQTGTGFDQNTGVVTGEKDSFTTGDDVFIVYTVTNPAPGAQVILKLFLGSTLESTSPPVALDTQTNSYANDVTVQNTGEHKVELDYNGVAEGSITFNVT